MKKRGRLKYILVFTVAFLLSYQITPHYIGGDQIAYNAVYEAVKGLSPRDAYHSYYLNLSSMEPVHFIIVYLSSNIGLSKQLVMSLSNAILASLIFYILCAYGLNKYIAVLITFTNYYIFVLFFSAERLKFGFLFLFIAIVLLLNGKSSLLSFLLSILSHFQMTILLFATLLTRSYKYLKKLTKKKIFFLFALFTFLILLIILFHQQLLLKAIYYLSLMNIRNILKLSVLMIACLLLSRRVEEIIVVFFVFAVAAYMFGDIRVNIFAYIFFLKYYAHANRDMQVVLSPVNLYFSYTGIMFIRSIFSSGIGRF